MHPEAFFYRKVKIGKKIEICCANLIEIQGCEFTQKEKKFQEIFLSGFKERVKVIKGIRDLKGKVQKFCKENMFYKSVDFMNRNQKVIYK